MHVIFIIALFAAAIFAIIESYDDDDLSLIYKRGPLTIDEITVVYVNGTAHFHCRSYKRKQPRKLVITYSDRENSVEKKEIASTDGYRLTVPLNGVGIYECLAKNEEGFASGILKLTNELNIFMGKNRDLKLYFRAFRGLDFVSFLYDKKDKNQDVKVSCLKDDQPLKVVKLNRTRGQIYTDKSPVSGVYKCVDGATGEVYGFETRVVLSVEKNQDKKPPKIDALFLFYENGSVHFGCKMYRSSKQRKLAITYNGNGNCDKKKEINSTDGKKLIVPLNDLGIYECSVKNIRGEASATVKLTNELNIFQGKNRHLKFNFRANRYISHYSYYTGFSSPKDYYEKDYFGYLSVKNNENQDVEVPCLQLNRRNREMYDIRYVSGVYKCVDNTTGEVYGFEIRIAGESFKPFGKHEGP